MENLEHNEYFQAITSHIPNIRAKAAKEGWMICVPRTGSIPPPYRRSIRALKAHILIPITTHKRTGIRVFQSLLSVDEPTQSRTLEYIYDSNNKTFSLKLLAKKQTNEDRDSDSFSSDDEDGNEAVGGEDDEDENGSDVIYSLALLNYLKQQGLEDLTTNLKQKQSLPRIKVLYQESITVDDHDTHLSFVVCSLSRSFFGNEGIPLLPNGKEIFIENRTIREWNEVFTLDGELSLGIVNNFDANISNLIQLIPSDCKNKNTYEKIRNVVLINIENESLTAWKSLVIRNEKRFGAAAINDYFKKILIAHFEERAMNTLYAKIIPFISSMYSPQQNDIQKNILKIKVQFNQICDVPKLGVLKKHHKFDFTRQSLPEFQRLLELKTPQLKLGSLKKIIDIFRLYHQAQLQNKQSSVSMSANGEDGLFNENESIDIQPLLIILITKSDSSQLYAIYKFMEEWTTSSLEDTEASQGTVERFKINNELQYIEFTLSLIRNFEDNVVWKVLQSSEDVSQLDQEQQLRVIQHPNQQQNVFSSFINFLKEAWSE